MTLKSFIRSLSLGFCSFALLLTTSNAFAASLGEITFSDFSGSSQIISEIGARFEFQGTGVSVFNLTGLTGASQGVIFSSTAATDSGFNAFAGLLTNGIDDILLIGVTSGFGTSYSGGFESGLFFGNPNLANGIDFEGSIIDSFYLRFDTLKIETPGLDLNGDGNWTDVYVQGVFSINDFPAQPAKVPEPSTILLLGLGGLVAFFKRKQ